MGLKSIRESQLAAGQSQGIELFLGGATGAAGRVLGEMLFFELFDQSKLVC